MHVSAPRRAAAARGRGERLLRGGPRRFGARAVRRRPAPPRRCPRDLGPPLLHRRAAGRRPVRPRIPRHPRRRAGLAARQRCAADSAQAGRDRRAHRRRLYRRGRLGRLRDLVAHPASPVAARILAHVVPELADVSEDTRLFFEALARLAPVLCTVRGLARHLRARPSTMMSRFYRAGLPSTKSYLAAMRLLHAAYLFQNPGLSVADIAYRLDFSSPQSFSRHLKTLLGVTETEFRHRFPFDVALARFCDMLITPYREVLREFIPVYVWYRYTG